MTEVMNEFKISKKEQGPFKYIGLNIEQTDKAIFVDQMEYVKSFKEINISAERKNKINDALDETEKKQLRSLCGQLLWPEQIKVVAYGDGSHNSLPNGDSQGGGKKLAPISWKYKKLERVTKSPLATEISAVADTGNYAYLVASMLKEIFCLEKSPVVKLMIDSKSLKDNLESTKVVEDPRQRVDVARLKHMVKRGEIQVKWVSSAMQLADSLTKRGASTDQLLRVLVGGMI
eukprot:gene759-47_t